MNFVEPIRDRRKIVQIKQYLQGAGRYRDLLLFVVGINTGLRISDLLALQVGAFVDSKGTILSEKAIREQKRGKRNVVMINDSIRETLPLYLAAYPGIETNPEHYLFFSTKRADYDYSTPLSRNQAWKLIADMCRDVGLSGNYGTHTLRKTWGYHARKGGEDLATIMHKFNHSNLATTMRYLGFTDDELRDVVKRVNL
jgi:integrase